jgi:hypothetical protein
MSLSREILAVEVTAMAIRCLRLHPLALGGGPPAFTECPLPPGLVVPVLDGLNVRDEAAFGRALAAAVGSRRPRMARLVLPDGAACLRVLRTAPAMNPGTNLRPFLTRRLQEGLPFPAREVRLAYTPAPEARPSHPMVLTLASWDRVISQYERLLGAAGIAVCHTAPAAWHLFHQADLAAPARLGVGAFLALGHEAATLFLTRAGVPFHVRTFQPAADQAGLVLEVYDTLAHAESTLGLPPPAQLTVAGEASSAPVRAALQQGLGLPCMPLAFGAGRHASELLPVGAQALLAAALAGTPIGLPALLPGHHGAPCSAVCNPPGGVCPRACRGAFLRNVAAGAAFAAALTLVGPTVASAIVEPAAAARGQLAQDEGSAAVPQDFQARHEGAAAADQHPPQPQDEGTAEAQDLQSPPMGAAEDNNDAPQQPAKQTTAPWPPWSPWR